MLGFRVDVCAEGGTRPWTLRPTHGQVISHWAEGNTAPSQSSEDVWPGNAHRSGMGVEVGVLKEYTGDQ